MLSAIIAMCNAGVANYNGAAVIAPTVTSESQNVLRSYGNLQQVSYNSKTIDTPYSSVSKHDVRVSNPGIAVSHQPAIAYHSQPSVAYHSQPAYQAHQPAITYQAQQPSYHSYHSAPSAHGMISFYLLSI